jgi:GNAT superfamily N-acetyltransferase
MPQITTRLATPDDAAAMAATFTSGFETYRGFAPPGWKPPPEAEERDRIAERLESGDVWALLGVTGDDVVGHVAFAAARDRTAADRGRHGQIWERPLVPGMAHLWQLFVRPPWWGTGVAGRLYDECLAAMRERGYARGRLFTPAGQARARAFYERRGWAAVAREPNPELGFDIVEYRIDLNQAPQHRRGSA